MPEPLPAAATMPGAPGDPVRFVLVGTSHGGNVGSTARAMKVMGFHDLVLVAPRHADVLSSGEARSLASGAVDVLDAARVVATLGEALGGHHLQLRDRHDAARLRPADARATAAVRVAGRIGHRVAFVFGSERFGMRNDDVYRCHAAVSIPTAPGYGSLNLAQAVQLIAYEWRQALGGFAVAPRTPSVRLADAPSIDGLLAHWRETLAAIGFLDPAAPRKLLPRLHRRLVNRAGLTVEEVQILRGIARSVGKAADR